MVQPENPNDQTAIEALGDQTAIEALDADSDDTAEGPGELTKDELFHVLQNERRRRVLQYMFAHGNERYEMSDIAEQVSAWEHDTTVRKLSSDERQRVYIALYQTHLPKLDDVGFINYNQKRGIVEETPLINQTAPHLERVEDVPGDETVDVDNDVGREHDNDADTADDSFSAAGLASLATGGLGAALLSMAVSVSSVVLAGMVGLLSVTLLGVLVQQLTVASP